MVKNLGQQLLNGANCGSHFTYIARGTLRADFSYLFLLMESQRY